MSFLLSLCNICRILLYGRFGDNLGFHLARFFVQTSKDVTILLQYVFRTLLDICGGAFVEIS